MMIRRPYINLIIAGDFNIRENPIPILRNISGEESTLIRAHQKTSKLDWILTNTTGEFKTETFAYECSDHKCIIVELSITAK